MGYDKKIDEMIEIDEATKKPLALLAELKELEEKKSATSKDISRVEKLMQQRVDICIEEGIDWDEDEEYSQLRDELSLAEANLEYLYDLISAKEEEYRQSEAEFQEFAGTKGYDLWNSTSFEYDKSDFLDELFASRIVDETEDTRVFFEKMIKLYGEDYLLSHRLSIHEQDVVHDELEIYEAYSFGIEDFIRGEEDNLIGLVTNDTLRKKMLANRLIDIYHNNDRADIKKYIQEYVEQASSNGVENTGLEDEYGLVNINETLDNFSILPMSTDRNFYLFLAKHLAEMNIPFEKYVDYIPQEFMDDKFGPELAKVINTGEYTYQTELTEMSEKPVKPELLDWLEGKEDELSAEEKTKKTIDEIKTLLDKQAEKRGEQK